MSRIKRLFAEHRWPWNVLTALCLLLGVLLLLRDRPGCPDVVVMHSDLARLDDALGDCCRCANRPQPDPVGGETPVGPQDPPIIPPDDIEERLRFSNAACSGPLCISLAWDTKDDIDLIVFEPDGHRIYFKQKDSPSGGHLDVDANGPQSDLITNPIENIQWLNPPNGSYKIVVSTYQLNEAREGSTIPATLRTMKDGQSKFINLTLEAKNGVTTQPIPLTYP